MTHWRTRMKHGLRWSDHNFPMPEFKHVVSAVAVSLIIVAAMLFCAWHDANAGMIEADNARVRAERNLVAILNGQPLVDAETKMAISAEVRVTEWKDLLVAR